MTSAPRVPDLESDCLRSFRSLWLPGVGADAMLIVPEGRRMDGLGGVATQELDHSLLRHVVDAVIGVESLPSEARDSGVMASTDPRKRPKDESQLKNRRGACTVVRDSKSLDLLLMLWRAFASCVRERESVVRGSAAILPYGPHSRLRICEFVWTPLPIDTEYSLLSGTSINS